MNNQEIIEMIHKTESATFRIDGLGESTIPTKKLEFLVDAHEKQIPKKVYKTNIPKGKFVYSCPSCGRIYQSGFDIGTKYCDECGQKIDWRAEE